MKISQIPAALSAAHKANLSVFLKGSPGTAKTALVRQFASSNNMRLVHIHAPLTDLLDIKGVISTAGDEAKFLPLNIWPKAGDAPVVVLIDELPQCVPAIQNAFSQLLIDKQMGDIKLPHGSLVVATGNRREDRAATHIVPSHVVNRVMHINVDRHNQDFFDWALRNNITPEIVAFGHFNPGAVYSFDPKNSQDPYATYRSWEYASNIIKVNPDPALLPELLAGVIGVGPATEFIAYKRMYQDLVSPQDVFAAPSIAEVPTDPGTLYAMAISLANEVDVHTSTAYFTYIPRLPTEYAVMSVKSAKTLYPGINKTAAFKTWAVNHSHIIL